MTGTPDPLTWQAMKPAGEAPISPDTPFDEDAYDAMIAAMEDLVAQSMPGRAQGTEQTGEEPKRGRS